MTLLALGFTPGDITTDGSIIVGSSNFTAAKWQAGQVTTLSPPLPAGTSGANGVSADGNVIVGTVLPFQEPAKAFRLQGTSLTYLPRLPGGVRDTAALDVSADGSVAVGFSDSSQGTQAIRWVGLAMQPLGDLDGGIFWSEARAVSADGSTVVGFGSPLPSGLYREAFRWTQTGGMVGLGFLPGATSSEAFGVSGDGSVVVGVSQYAFIWDAQHGMRKLEDVLVHDLGLDLQGFLQIGAATAITPDGKTIVGYGLNSQFYQEAWIAHIPEPATLVLLAGGSAVLTRRSGRRAAS